MTLVLFAAVTDNGVIGSGNSIPWQIPGEQRRVKDLTMGKTLVMGRRTFESIGRPLPGRRSIVVTRDPQWSHDGVTVVHSVADALTEAGDGEVIVFGGGEIYAQTIDQADRLEITHVHQIVDGDARFPEIDHGVWDATATDPQDGYTYVSYRRRTAAVTDLAELLAGLQPQLQEGEYVFATLGEHDGLPVGLTPVATIREPEGTTLVLPVQQAETASLATDFRASWIILRVHSDLAAVGLTAAVSTALARDGIACNMIAGFHHDHLFVPVDRARDALAALAALAHTRVAARPGV